MQRKYKTQTTSTHVSRVTLLFEKVISAVCLVVLLVSPLAPIYASEIDETQQVAEPAPVSEAPVAESEPSEEPDLSEESTIEENLISPEDSSVEESDVPVLDIPASSASDGVSQDVEDQSPLEESVENPIDTPEPDASHEGSEGDDVDTPEPDTTHEDSEENVADTEESLSSTTVTDIPLEIADPSETVREEIEEELHTATSTTDEDQQDERDDEVLADEAQVEALSDDVSVVFVENDTSAFKFEKNECVVTGGDAENGTFFCTKSKEKPLQVRADGVYAALDEEGDKEIYSEKDGEVTAITNNHLNDDAPQYDETSNTIVWHRDIDGRYQIVVFDVETGEEKQLTFDRYNNMQPGRYADTIVWQGWVGEDWEIFALTDDELTMITDNATQDIDPSINGTHIVWQAFEENAWKMKVYDIRTKHIETIEDADGGSIENPRFVLVYDTKFESGDIETRGYDIKTGAVVPLSATPAPLPEKIPEPDQTGEDRALVSPQTQPKTKVEGDDDSDPTDDPVPSTDNGDLVIPSLVIDNGTTTSDSLLDESTLIIETVETSATSSTIHIEDVIVTPYVAPIATSTDSQEAIAETE